MRFGRKKREKKRKAPDLPEPVLMHTCDEPNPIIFKIECPACMIELDNSFAATYIRLHGLDAYALSLINKGDR
jgi:hypothetical protein